MSDDAPIAAPDPLSEDPSSADSDAADAAFADVADLLASGAESGVEGAPESIAISVPTGSDGGQVTEWFSVEDDLRGDDEPVALPRREHVVTTVVVSHDGAVWLPAVLTLLAGQTRPPDAVVGVDTGSVDDSVAVLSASFGPERIVTVPTGTGFGAAVAAGLDDLARAAAANDIGETAGRGGAAVEWVWLLHDDSAPSVDCLEQLLRTADDNPSASILGPKILGWHDRRLLLEAGVSVDGSGRRVTGLERREHDQGQHDGVRDVLAVSSAGMLVRRDVWDALEGFDPDLPLFRDDLDLCWRAHRRGERVLVATDAVLHHREASAHGRRVDDEEARPHRADREAAAHVLLAHAHGGLAPFLALRLLVASVFRAGIYLLGKDVAAARDEVGAVGALVFHPGRVRRSRQVIARTTTLPASVVRSLRPSALSQARQGLEALAGVVTTSNATAPSSAVSALDSGPVGDDADYLDDGSGGLVRRLLTTPAVLLVAVLAILAVIGTRGLWLGAGVLQGGTLLPVPAGAGDLWEAYRQAWHDVGPGAATPAAPYLVVVAALATILLGKASAAVSVLVLLVVPLAGWSAYIALRGLVPGRAIRVWAAATYALLPAVTGALAAGRIGTTIAAVVLPFAVRSLVRSAGPRGTLRRAGGTAILVAVVLATAPAAWVVLVVAGAAVCVVRVVRRDPDWRAPALRLVIGLLAPIVVLLPWSLHVITNPALLLLEPGLSTGPTTDAALQPWQVLMLHPGGPGMTPVWLSVGIVLAGGLAMLRADRTAVTGPIAALGGVALAMALVQSVVLVTVPGTTISARPWPGPATLLFGGALIAIAAVGADGLRERLTRSSFTLGQPVTLVVLAFAVLTPTLSAIAFGGGLDLVIRRAPADAVPAFVAADAESPQAPRTLVLSDDRSGRLQYTIVNGAGPSLGDAETGPPASAWQALDPYVAAMASGRGGDEIAALAGYGIRYVLLAPRSSRDLIPTLDGEPGLRRLSSSRGEVLWRVAGVTSRARIVTDDKSTPVGLTTAGTSTDPYLDQQMPDGDAGRVLALGVLADDGWRAVADDDAALSPVTAPGLLSWAQSFAVPAGTPTVVARFDDGARVRWLWLQLFVLGALVVLALPERRREDPDPDRDDEPTDSDQGDPEPGVSEPGDGTSGDVDHGDVDHGDVDHGDVASTEAGR